MAILNNANVRGTIVTSKQHENDVFQYLILIDQPASSPIEPVMFMFAEPGGPGATVMNYNFMGTLVDPVPGEKVITYMLPMCVSKNIADPDESGTNLTVVITDSQGNTASGNPNQGRPPVIKFMDRGGTFTASTAVILSASNNALSNPLDADCFLITLVNTLPNGGFTKYFQSISPTDNYTNLLATLNPEAGKQVVLVTGAFPSAWDQYGSVYILNPDDQSTTGPFVFDYLNYTPL